MGALHSYDLRWYLGWILDLVSASIFLFVLLGEAARVHADLLRSHANLNLSYADLHTTYANLTHAAQIDPLTKVATRDYILECMQVLLTAQIPFCLAMFDLDHFKAINDKYGHLVGDDVLRVFSRRVLHTTKAKDLLGRLSGEEFVLVYAQLDLPLAIIAVERVLETIRSEPIATGVGQLALTTSAGLVVAAQDESLSSLLARADAALYLAKANGRDRLMVGSVAEGVVE